jgi:biotin transporter BioY
MIIGYIITFIIVGFLIGIFSKDNYVAIGIIIVISVLWMFPFGPWAIATLIELMIGYKVQRILRTILPPKI